jgi:hypothetical protein
MKKNNTEVMEVEAEEMLHEEPLEKVIETALVKANITEQVIAKLQETYGGMQLKSLEDKESYLEIKEARKSVRKVGIITENLCKKGRERAVKEQRLWLDKQNEILDKIAKVQDPLDAEIKKFEDEVERKENEEKQKREEAFIARQASLLKYGAEYKNGNYELGEISYEIELVKQADEDMWNDTILPKYKRVYEQKESARVAEEEKRKAEADRLKAEQDKFAEEQRKFKEQQDLFEKQQKELQDKINEQNRLQREAEDKKAEEIRKQKAERMDKRISLLRSLCEPYDYRTLNLKFEGKPIMDCISDIEDDKWNESVDLFSVIIDKIKKEKEAEEKTKLDLETRRKTGKARYEILKDMGFETENEVNLSTITDEHWQNMYAGYRKAYDDKKKKEWEAQQKLKKQLEDEQKQKELDAANDKTKYADVVKYLSACPTYEMKSSLYKSKMNIIRDFIDDLKEN